MKDFANVERALERGITPVTLEEASKVSSHLPRIPGKILGVVVSYHNQPAFPVKVSTLHYTAKLTNIQ